MIEAGANEVPEQKMIDAIFKAHEVNQKSSDSSTPLLPSAARKSIPMKAVRFRKNCLRQSGEIVPPVEMETAVFTDDKQTREKNIAEITARLEEAFAGNEEWLAVLGEAVYQYQKKTVRKMILKDHKRPDGRAIDEIRHLAAEIDLLPRVHGSGMFTRGQTRSSTPAHWRLFLKPRGLTDWMRMKPANATCTIIISLSFSVGETKPSRGPGRREIGHGALAERAPLIPVLPSAEEFPYAIRTVSETMESNGSTSQASICASTLSLMAAGVPIKEMVAGIPAAW